jgi:hypothetical protein
MKIPLGFQKSKSFIVGPSLLAGSLLFLTSQILLDLFTNEGKARKSKADIHC